MTLRLVLIATLFAACASGKPTTTAPPGGSGSGSATPVPVVIPNGPITSCETAQPKLEALYRADAEATMPGAEKAGKRNELVADNVHLVMMDCLKDPQKIYPCIDRAKAVADVEHTCLAALDDEGTEGDALKASKGGAR